MIWLTAAVGLTSGSGPWALETAATAIHLIVVFVYTPLVRLLATLAYSLISFRVSTATVSACSATYSLRRPRWVRVVSNVQVDRLDDDREIAVSMDAEGRGESARSGLAAVDRIPWVRGAGVVTPLSPHEVVPETIDGVQRVIPESPSELVGVLAFSIIPSTAKTNPIAIISPAPKTKGSRGLRWALGCGATRVRIIRSSRYVQVPVVRVMSSRAIASVLSSPRSGCRAPAWPSRPRPDCPCSTHAALRPPSQDHLRHARVTSQEQPPSPTSPSRTSSGNRHGAPKPTRLPGTPRPR